MNPEQQSKVLGGCEIASNQALRKPFGERVTDNFNDKSRVNSSLTILSACRRWIFFTVYALIALQIMSQSKLVLAVNPVLDINGTFPYLINKTTGQITEPRDYMDFENIYAPNDTYRENQTAQGRVYHLIKAFDFANYYQSDYWHYSSEDDLKLSAAPVANVHLCGQHLNWLESRINQSENLFKQGEQHVNLMSYVDSFGRPEAGTYYGHGYWLGSYYQCTKVSIHTAKYAAEECRSNPASSSCFDAQSSTLKSSNGNPTEMKMRYCIGKGRDQSWQDDDYVPTISYKIGLCLPETCETLSFRRHREQIERLMRYNMPDYTKSRINLNDMYCLPDKRSPIRSLPLSTRIFLGICGIWLMILLAATSVYSCYKRQQRDLRNIIIADQVHRDLSLCTAASAAAGNHQQIVVNQVSDHKLNSCCCEPSEHILNNGAMDRLLIMKVEQEAALNLNSGVELSRLTNELNDRTNTHLSMDSKSNASFSTSTSSSAITSGTNSTSSSWLNLAESPLIIKIVKALSIKENMREFQEPPLLLKNPEENRKLRINLNALDAIKCLCCILVIFGHIVFIHMQHLSNIVHTIELSYELYPRFLIAFFNFVDTFFIVSGMLTAYFIFKRFNEKTFSNPLVWFQISLLRLLRLSPVYVLVFWFTKTVTVYISEGPVWDYGTDKNSIKGLCINDHWWKSILYLGNLGTMQPLCILPAWSIVVDAQYSLVLPPIIFFIFKHKRLTYLSLLIAIIISSAKMSFQLANQTAVKTSDMAKIRLHVYPLISRFAAEFYNTAWNRIGPVAIGLLGGHMLYYYDIGKIKRWPWFMRGASFKFILILHVVIFFLPAIGRFTDQPDATNETDMTIFILSNATIKPIWSLINTIFLLRLVTDLRVNSVMARLMSHNLWHCLGKLCFASYLIHYEVILVLLKSRKEGLVDLNWSNAAREFSFAFLTSTVISYIIYILYEAPINKMITLAVSKPTYMKKVDDGTNNEKQLTVHNQQHIDHHCVGGGKFSASIDMNCIDRSSCKLSFNPDHKHLLHQQNHNQEHQIQQGIP